MNESLRPWFYAACFIVWVIVGLVPAVHTNNVEQDRLDREFYNRINVPSPQQLFDDGTAIISQMQKIQTWDDYQNSLKSMWQHELYVEKPFSLLPDDPKSMQLIRIVQGRLMTMSVLIQQKQRDLELRIGHPTGRFEGRPTGRDMTPFSLLWPAVWTSWIFALLVLLVRIDACEQSVWIELATPWWLALATFLWPIGLFKYPTGDPARQLVRGLRFAAFALTTALGFMPATAFAQQVKKDDGKKKSSPYTLNLDVRNTEVIGPTPNPELLVKGTLITPTGWVVQSTDVHRQNGFWATTKMAGHIAWNKSGVRVDAVGGISKNSTGAVVASAGSIVSVNRSRFVTAFPIIAFERRLDKPMNDFTFANQTLLKLGVWRAGVETSFKKVFNSSPVQYYVGGVVGRNLGKKAYVEVASYRDQTGAWRIRGRTTYALSW